MRAVSALYIDPRGLYPKIPGLDCWDASRDATLYSGPNPIIAHPACGPWGKLAHQYKGGEGGPELALIAVKQVRMWGGVLEHPAHSRLWKCCGLPRPGDPPDQFGGWTESINQSDFGHVARKPTWVYCVGVDRELSSWRPAPREPTHWISGGRGREGKKKKQTPVPPGIKICSGQQRKRTPMPCAEWLVSLARSVRL